MNTTYSGTTNIPETKNNQSSRNNNKTDSKSNEINLINNYNIDNYSTSNYTDTTNSNSKNEHIQKYKRGGKILYTGEINSNYNSGSSRKSISKAPKIKQKKDTTTYNDTTNTVSISTKNIKTRSQKNNTKNTSLKHESIADLSDSTFETINQGRKKLRTGRTQFIRTNSNNIHTEAYNNNMKETNYIQNPTTVI